MTGVENSRCTSPFPLTELHLAGCVVQNLLRRPADAYSVRGQTHETWRGASDASRKPVGPCSVLTMHAQQGRDPCREYDADGYNAAGH